MKTLIAILTFLTICFGCYYYGGHSKAVKRTTSYVVNTAIEKTSGALMRFCTKEHLSSQLASQEYVHTTNLYDIEYDIIQNGNVHNVKVTTYGTPNVIRVGNHETIIYDFPDGGQYKFSGDSKTKIKIRAIKKIN